MYETVPIESIKDIGKSIGIEMNDKAAENIAEEVSYQLKEILFRAKKFLGHSKKRKMTKQDIDHAMKKMKIAPANGFVCRDHIPFRFASGGGRDLDVNENTEIDLHETMNSVTGQIPKLPPDVIIRTHWLAIDGVQPTVPDNPPPISKDIQKLESIDPSNKLIRTYKSDVAKPGGDNKLQKFKNTESVYMKQSATHELTAEQNLYFKEITEACIGPNETHRAIALQSLSTDSGLHEVLTRLCTFITEGVRINVVQRNLALLIYLMRMIKALMDNPHFNLEKYIHDFISSVATCIVSKQLCVRPETDNHWALRDFASRLMAQICKTFHTSTNNLQTRVSRLFIRALAEINTVPLTSLYGAIDGLCELGPEVIKGLIIPKLKDISERLEICIENPDSSLACKNDAQHIKMLLIKSITPVLITIRRLPDYSEEYKNDYGYIGLALYKAVIKYRPESETLIVSTTNTTINQNNNILENIDQFENISILNLSEEIEMTECNVITEENIAIFNTNKNQVFEISQSVSNVTGNQQNQKTEQKMNIRKNEKIRMDTISNFDNQVNTTTNSITVANVQSPHHFITESAEKYGSSIEEELLFW